jgi:uncharacterized protein (TIGR03067 family)
MRSLFATLLVGTVFTLTVGCGKKDGAASLEGTYLIVEMDTLGIKITEDDLKGKAEAERTFVIKGDKIIATKGGKEDPATFKTDASKSPAHIDLTGDKDGKAEKMYGIYKLEGDTLTICIGLPADRNGESKPEDRPKDFKATKDVPTITMVLKKKK